MYTSGSSRKTPAARVRSIFGTPLIFVCFLSRLFGAIASIFLSPFFYIPFLSVFTMIQRSIALQLAAIISSSVIFNVWVADPAYAQDDYSKCFLNIEIFSDREYLLFSRCYGMDCWTLTQKISFVS